MDDYVKLSALTDLAESLGVTIRRIPSSGGGDHPGGAVVKLKGKEVVFLDPTATGGDQVDVLVECLRGHDELQDRFLAPEIRELLER